MKGSLLWKLAYVFCALAGCLAGYGVFALTSNNEIKPNTITKDNTLVREAEDSVFFDAEQQEELVPAPTTVPTTILTITETPIITEEPEMTVVPKQNDAPIPTPESVIPPVAAMPDEPTEFSRDKQENVTEMLPSLASQWANTGLAVPTQIPVVPPVNDTEHAEQKQEPVKETLTYPAEIFGQVPVINRSDTYVSYFEFAYDLVSALEPEVKQRGLNLNALLAKFVIRALFCGVDIEKLEINAPIPRRLAALCLWLAAQILEEEGCDTSVTSAGTYVTDISNCSKSEKKAVAYLYEQGILKGYQVPGQRFYPEAGLKTESGTTWISGAKQCWK